MFWRIAVIAGMLLTACDTQVTQPTIEPVSYVLRVSHGTGSGRYSVGDVVHIWANPYDPGWAFDSWKGDTAQIPDLRSMHATLIMPPSDLRIEATYKQIPVWQAYYDLILNRDVYYYFPPVAKGVIVFFHGSGGDARDWTDLGAERRHFFDEAIANEYAIIAIDSIDQINRQWDISLPVEANPDVRAVQAILQDLKKRNQISATVPVYGVGMSRGGKFAALAGETLDMKAVALMVADSLAEVISVSTLPMLWCLAARDVIIDKDQAFLNYQQLQKRGIDADFYVHPSTPLYPLYFVNTNGVDYVASVRLFSDLKNNGFLDENNFLLENPRFSGWEKLAADYPEEIRIDLGDRLFVAYGEHAFYSDCDHRILDFFARHP